MNIHPAVFLPSSRAAGHAARWCAVACSCLLPAVALRAAETTPAASSSVDRLISKLPDPSQFTKSPLESAVEDRTETTPEYRQIVSSMQRHDYPAALRQARTLSARYPDSHPKIHLIHGLLAMVAKQPAEADQAFHTLVTVSPRSGLGWLALGRIQFEQRRYPEALAYARKSVAADPTFTFGWLGVAGCEYQLRHLPEAVTAAHQATQTNPRSVGAWYALGRYEIVQHKFDQAGADFQRAANLAPNILPIQGALALCYIEGGKTADAIPPLERVVSKAPNDVLAAVKLGYCYLATGKAAQGVEVCRRAVKVQPKYAAAWDMLGQCYRRAGRNREAVDAFQHAVNLAPGDLNARTHLDEARQAGSVPART